MINPSNNIIVFRRLQNAESRINTAFLLHIK